MLYLFWFLFLVVTLIFGSHRAFLQVFRPQIQLLDFLRTCPEITLPTSCRDGAQIYFSRVPPELIACHNYTEPILQIKQGIVSITLSPSSLQFVEVVN